MTQPQIHFTAQGTGTPVVLLHGTAATGGQWKGLAEHLANRHRVFRPDLPGYGRSAAVEADSIDAIVDALAPVFAACDGPFHLVGHSFGGAVALRAAQRLGTQVQSLTLIEPAAFQTLLGTSAEGLFAPLRSIAQALSVAADEGDPSAGMTRFVDYWFGPGAWTKTSIDLRRRLAGMAATALRDFAAIAQDTGAGPAAPALCPSLAIGGGATRAPVKAVLDTLGARQPELRTEWIAGAGHMPHLTDPHLTDPMIASHIDAAEDAPLAWAAAA